MLYDINKRCFSYILFGMILILVSGFLVYRTKKSNIVTTFSPLIRQVENTRISYMTDDYPYVMTEHFIIRYDEGIDRDILDLVEKTAEEKYNQMVEIFNYQVSNKILIVLYNDVEELKKNTMLKEYPPPMGVYYANSIHLLNPRYWIEEENLEKVFYSQGPMLHELAHLFVDHIAKGNYPAWFTEGVSLYLEYEVDGYQWGEEVDLKEEEYTLEILTNKFHQLDEYLAYTQSFRIIKKFVSEKGMKSLIDIIKALGEGNDIQNFISLF